MKRTIWTYGLISGAIISVLFSATILIGKNSENYMDSGMIVGYVVMFLALSLVYFGIRSYRENYTDGRLSFGKAFKIGILIALISSVIYALTWLVINNFFFPEFVQEYTDYTLNQLRESGASPQEIQQQTETMEYYGELYANPLL